MPSSLPVIESYSKFLSIEPIILYVNVDYHGTFPFYVWDTTHLFIDRKYNPTGITENQREMKVEKAFITRGLLNIYIYSTIENGNAHINLYNASGQKIKTLYSGKALEKIRINTDISNLKNGIYFIREVHGRIPTVKILKN